MGQTFRDYHWATAYCFYFPSPLAAAALLGVSAALCATRKARSAIAAGVLALAPLSFVVAVENQWLPPHAPDQRGSLRLVHWNVGWGIAGWERIARALEARHADLYVISEVPGKRGYQEIKQIAARFGADYSVLNLSSLAVVAKGHLGLSKCFSEKKPEIFAVNWYPGGERAIRLLVVDVPSAILTERAPILSWVRDCIRDDQPDLVVGDFNAPRRSRAIDELPAGYRHAYAEAGAGWSYTWPASIPLLAIDQCIVGRAIAAHRYRLRSTGLSDHRMQQLDFTLVHSEDESRRMSGSTKDWR